VIGDAGASTDAEIAQAEADLGIVNPTCDPTLGACTP